MNKETKRLLLKEARKLRLKAKIKQNQVDELIRKAEELEREANNE